jgi:hypothetical protein
MAYYFEDVPVLQAKEAESKFIKILKDFDRIIEIGTYSGGFTLFLHKNKKENCELISYDINASHNKVPKTHNIDFRIGDCFSDFVHNEIKNLIIDDSKRILLLCDGGNKNKEFNIFSKYLKINDVIMCHDYAETADEFKKFQIILNWQLFNYESSFDMISKGINEHNLIKYEHYDEFKSVLWGAFTK